MVLDVSLLKGPGIGTGGSGNATINGWEFRIDPASVALPIKAKIQKYRTIGGFVVQVYGTTWGDLTVTGEFGWGGWRAQLTFLDRMVDLARAQAIQRTATLPGQNFTPSQPFRFTYPLLGWDFLCYLKDYTSPDGPLAVRMANDNISPKWTLTLFIVTENNSLAILAKTALLQRLAPGLGVMWDSSSAASGGQTYQGYADDQYNSPLTSADVQAYVNSPSGSGSSADVIPAVPSNLSGPVTGPGASGSSSTGAPGSGSDPSGGAVGTIATPSDFARAVMADVSPPITPTNTNVNLMRAWQCQEGMWGQALLSDGSYPGGWTSWGAPYMNNPLNIGGGTSGSNGQKGTYNGYPVMYLDNGWTGVTFSFLGNWTAGVKSTVYFMNVNTPAIIDALRSGDPGAFESAVEAWNPGQASYSADVMGHYNSGDYVSAGY